MMPDEGAEGASSSSSWADLAPDALALIFRHLPLHQLLTVIPFVCKPWKLASLNPLCYQTLDLIKLFHPLCKEGDDDGDHVCEFSWFIEGYALTEVLLTRSQGCLLEISYPRFMDNLRGLYHIARSAPLLQKLHIPMSCANNEWATYAAPLMPHIVDLDLSMCDSKLSHEAIEAFGKSCKHMRCLRRNRPPLWDQDCLNSDDCEALTIAKYYPCLEHLELQGNPMSNKGLQAILESCPLLVYLDVSGCEHLEPDTDSELFDNCQMQVKVFINDFSGDEDSDDYFDG